MTTPLAQASTMQFSQGSVTVAMRMYFSSYHLHAAKQWAARAAQIEALHTGGTRFDIELRSVVSGAVIFSVAFLEAAINELYQDAVDSHLSYCGTLALDKRDELVALWKRAEGRDLTTLDKYNSALEAAAQPKMLKGEAIYQNAALVITLRNCLIHYRPETLTAASAHRLAIKLKKRFESSALMTGSGNPWFPDHCMGAGCAQWAIASSVALADACFQRLSIVPNYQRVRF